MLDTNPAREEAIIAGGATLLQHHHVCTKHFQPPLPPAQILGDPPHPEGHISTCSLGIQALSSSDKNEIPNGVTGMGGRSHAKFLKLTFPL